MYIHSKSCFFSESVFNSPSLISAAGGFLVPLKDHGSLNLFDLDRSPPTQYTLTHLSSDTAWFYHRIEWTDMNGDGLLDIVTCRAKTHLLGR